LVHCTETVPVASTFVLMEPEAPKFTPDADTVQFARTVAVHTVFPA